MVGASGLLLDGRCFVRHRHPIDRVSFLVHGEIENFMSIFFVSFVCAVCFGSPDLLSSKAVWAGVFFLLGVVGFVLGVIAWTGFVWAKRARKTELPNP